VTGGARKHPAAKPRKAAVNAVGGFVPLLGHRRKQKPPEANVQKTRQILESLNTNYSRLAGALQRGKVRAPDARDASGDFLWSPAEVEAARQALAVDRRFKRKVESR
jgi:hypothetical protein